MELYLVRHGIAVERGTKGIRTDAGRMLTEAGIRKTRQAAAGLLAFEKKPDLLISSPYVRALQTAEIFAEVFNIGKTIAQADELAPGACASESIQLLAKRDERTIMLFGHMPGLEELGALLLAGDASLDLPFKKAGVCKIAFSGKPAPKEGSLVWFLQPKQLRLLNKSASARN
ncbi:MAG: phosphohistidine phosphatase SixA [Chitinivibrionales bacterium]|nr:phosphohistidine phosphatase SixA [Chitinivibrionales bacterium]